MTDEDYYQPIRIVLKAAPSAWHEYEITTAELSRLREDWSRRHAPDIQARGGAYAARDLNGQPRLLLIEFDEVAFIG